LGYESYPVELWLTRKEGIR